MELSIIFERLRVCVLVCEREIVCVCVRERESVCVRERECVCVKELNLVKACSISYFEILFKFR